MSNIDKEWLQQKIADMGAARDDIPFGLDEDDSNMLAALRIALASLEAEPVGYMNRFTGRVFTLEEQPGADTDVQVYVPVYTSLPAPVVMDEAQSRVLFEKWCSVNIDRNKWHPEHYAHLPAREQWDAWEACRAAMPQGADGI